MYCMKKDKFDKILIIDFWIHNYNISIFYFLKYYL